MKRNSLVRILVVGVGVIGFVGCADDDQSLPAGVAAQVGDHSITAAQVERATVGRRAFRAQPVAAPAYRPNDIEGCIAWMSRRPATMRTAEDELRRRCERRRDRERDAAVGLLIRKRWYILEARRQGISVPADGREELLAQSKRSGIRPADLAGLGPIYQLRIQLVTGAAAEKPTFPKAEIARYYRAHRERYVSEPQRFVDAVVIGTRAHARRVAEAFREGRTSAELVKRFKSEGAIRPYDGNLENTAFNERETLQQAAQPLGIGGVGMVKDPRGWYVFRVGSSQPEVQPTLARATAAVVSDLEVRFSRRVNATYDARLRARYRDDTTCADGYSAWECR